MLQNPISELSVRIFSFMWGLGKVWLWSSVSVFNSIAIRQLSKKGVTVVHFEILASVLWCQTKPKWLWRRGVCCLDWGVFGGFSVTGHILWHLCKIHVTSMSQQLREEWRPYDPPIICAAEEDFIPLCYFNYAFLLYFLYCDILYHSNKYISLIFASSLV